MIKFYFLSIFVIVLLFFSCEKKTKTQPVSHTTEVSKLPASKISVKNLMQKETKSAHPNLNFIRENIKAAGEKEANDEKSKREKTSVELLSMALESYTKGSYQDCISYAAQIPLSDPLFSPAQYLVAYSFFHTQAYERAVEIFKGMSQNRDFFKNINPTEAGWMHILAQYNFNKKSNDKFQEKELRDAIDYFLAKDYNNNSTYSSNVELLKKEL